MSLTVGRVCDMIELYVQGEMKNHIRLNPMYTREMINIKLREFMRESGHVMDVRRLTSTDSQQEYQLPSNIMDVQRVMYDGVEATKIAYTAISDMYNLTTYTPETTTVADEYTWKYVALTVTTDVQILKTSAGELVSDNLDSNNSLPTFTTTDNYVVELGHAYQDWYAHITTEYITAGNYAFGIQLSSTAGSTDTPHFDITIRSIQ